MWKFAPHFFLIIFSGHPLFLQAQHISKQVLRYLDLILPCSPICIYTQIKFKTEEGLQESIGFSNPSFWNIYDNFQMYMRDVSLVPVENYIMSDKITIEILSLYRYIFIESIFSLLFFIFFIFWGIGVRITLVSTKKLWMDF